MIFFNFLVILKIFFITFLVNNYSESSKQSKYQLHTSKSFANLKSENDEKTLLNNYDKITIYKNKSLRKENEALKSDLKTPAKSEFNKKKSKSILSDSQSTSTFRKNLKSNRIKSLKNIQLSYDYSNLFLEKTHNFKFISKSLKQNANDESPNSGKTFEPKPVKLNEKMVSKKNVTKELKKCEINFKGDMVVCFIEYLKTCIVTSCYYCLNNLHHVLLGLHLFETKVAKDNLVCSLSHVGNNIILKNSYDLTITLKRFPFHLFFLTSFLSRSSFNTSFSLNQPAGPDTPKIIISSVGSQNDVSKHVQDEPNSSSDIISFSSAPSLSLQDFESQTYSDDASHVIKRSSEDDGDVASDEESPDSNITTDTEQTNLTLQEDSVNLPQTPENVIESPSTDAFTTHSTPVPPLTNPLSPPHSPHASHPPPTFSTTIFEENTTQHDEDISAPTKEAEMPSFDEWKQKQEKELINNIKTDLKMQTQPPAGQTIPNGTPGKKKINYSSVTCGAKIIQANPESQNPSSILKENKDEYMNNPCTVKNGFTIELCEGVQIHSIELGNIEFFSSLPGSFDVHVSERFPIKEWTYLGTFNASNERIIQKFDVSFCPFFAKYIRVDILSHYGSEHYCPISILRVFGTSLGDDEEVELRDESDYNDEVNDAPNENLLKKATDTVISLMKTVLPSSEAPPPVAVGEVKTGQPGSAIQVERYHFLMNCLFDYNATIEHFFQKFHFSLKDNDSCLFFKHLFNAQFLILPKSTATMEHSMGTYPSLFTSFKLIESSPFTDSSSQNRPIEPNISSFDEIPKGEDQNVIEPIKQSASTAHIELINNSIEEASLENEEMSNGGMYVDLDISIPTNEMEQEDTKEGDAQSGASRLEPLKDYESTEAPYQKTLSKETIFLKLKHRIKQLEISLNLTNRYLEELSKRYKKEMEEMYNSMNKTISKLINTAKSAEERDLKQQDRILNLEKQACNQSSLSINFQQSLHEIYAKVIKTHIGLISFEVIFFLIVVSFCCNNSRSKTSRNDLKDTLKVDQRLRKKSGAINEKLKEEIKALPLIVTTVKPQTNHQSNVGEDTLAQMSGVLQPPQLHGKSNDSFNISKSIYSTPIKVACKENSPKNNLENSISFKSPSTEPTLQKMASQNKSDYIMNGYEDKRNYNHVNKILPSQNDEFVKSNAKKNIKFVGKKKFVEDKVLEVPKEEDIKLYVNDDEIIANGFMGNMNQDNVENNVKVKIELPNDSHKVENKSTSVRLEHSKIPRVDTQPCDTCVSNAADDEERGEVSFKSMSSGYKHYYSLLPDMDNYLMVENSSAETQRASHHDFIADSTTVNYSNGGCKYDLREHRKKFTSGLACNKVTYKRRYKKMSRWTCAMKNYRTRPLDVVL